MLESTLTHHVEGAIVSMLNTRRPTKAELLPRGYGITNVVNRATATAAELFRGTGGGWPAPAGYRAAFGRPKAGFGQQDEPIAEAIVWVLPNPSGLSELKPTLSVFLRRRLRR
jgi:hypothetical protein